MSMHFKKQEFTNSNGVVVAILCDCGSFHKVVGVITLWRWDLTKKEVEELQVSSVLTHEQVERISQD